MLLPEVREVLNGVGADGVGVKFPQKRPFVHNSGRKKEPKPKLFGPDIFQWGRGLPRERVGAKKFDTSLETRETKLFGRDIPGFCRDIPGAPEKFEKRKFGFNFRSLIILFVRNFWRVCSQFWLSVRNSV